MRTRKQTIGVLAVAALVIASGCLTVTVSSKVNNQGTIDEYEMELAMPQMMYSQMQQQAQANGTTLEESIKSDYNEDNYGSVSVDATTEERNGQEMGVITITLKNFDPADIQGQDFNVGGTQSGDQSAEGGGPQISVTVEDDRIIYEDDTFYNDSTQTDGGDGGDVDMGGSFELTYELTMPGKIIEDETNADEIDGKTATWERNGTEVFSNTEIRAVSEKGSGSSGPLGLPGFGAGLALVALVVAAGALAAVRRRD